jgi:hypothetical protein
MSDPTRTPPSTPPPAPAPPPPAPAADPGGPGGPLLPGLIVTVTAGEDGGGRTVFIPYTDPGPGPSQD